MSVQASSGSPRPWLTFGSTLAQGEELCAVARIGAHEALPATVKVTGTLDGQPFVRDIPVPLAGLAASGNWYTRRYRGMGFGSSCHRD